MENMQKIIRKSRRQIWSEKRAQFMEYVSLLREAGNAVRDYVCNGEISAFEYLAQMQEMAILLGTGLDETIGEGSEEVSLLEKYCELVWKCNNTETAEEILAVLEEMEQLVLRVGTLVSEDMKEKKIIVFLPYKASMWDSLESIWKAAVENPDCEPYVVPIPYYDKLPNGRFGEMHYEGERFPKYVPVVPYQEFNLALEQPDVIFFHNPYDAFNHVTTVHPAFYSDKLKKYTKKLVYVPYYVSLNTVTPESVTMPGAVFADLVYVSSEKIREVYLKAFTEMREQEFHTEQLKDEKIIVAGSPKVDRVEYYIAHPELCECPEEWKSMLYRNGEKRKALLLNTSLGDMLRHGQVHVDGIKRAIEEFKRRDDCVLWWRPHPLVRPTLEFVQPEIYHQYVALEEQYLEENIGIFDTTEDVERAIVMTDGYYGVPSSSLVTMYGLTGKPILVHETEEEIYEHSAEDVASFHDFVTYGEYIYFSANNMNGLFRMHLETKEYKYLGEFPGENLKWHLHMGAVLVGTQIWFAPFDAKKLSIYNIETEEFVVKDIIPDKEKTAKYGKILHHRGRVFLIPVFADSILEINTQDFSVIFHRDWLDSIREANKRYLKDGYVRNGACIYEDEMFISARSADILIRINLNTGEMKKYCIPYETYGVHEISCRKGMVYIHRRQGQIPMWFCIHTEQFGICEPLEKIWENCLQGGIVALEKSIVLYPGANNNTFCIRECGATECSLVLQHEVPRYTGNWNVGYYVGKKLNETQIVLSSGNDNATVIFDAETMNVERIQLFIPRGEQYRFRTRDRDLWDNPGHFKLKEDRKTMLSDFVSYLAEKDRYCPKQRECYRNIFYQEEGKTCGELILEDVLSKL